MALFLGLGTCYFKLGLFDESGGLSVLGLDLGPSRNISKNYRI